jgi:large subunit ribosomal protein L40e
MQIYIKTLTNTISLQVDSTYSINKVKKILCDRQGIPITEQRLLFSGKQLQDNKTVAYYPIQRESTLYLMRRLRGGGGGGVTFNDDFTLTLTSSGSLVARCTGNLDNNIDGANFSLINILSLGTEEVVPLSVAGRLFTDNYDGISVFEIKFTIDVTANGFVTYFKQLMRFAFYIKYDVEGTTVSTNTIVNYLFIPSTTNNILMTGNKIKSITTVNISSKEKSVILPPITTRTPIINFKVIARTAPYILQIIPYFSTAVPIIYTLYQSFPTFDSTIDGNANQLYLDTLNQAVSLVSDGTNWTVVNSYSDTLTVTTINDTLPSPILSETSEKTVVQYTYTGAGAGANDKMILYTMSSSYLKYIFLKNSDPNSLSFVVYFPNGTRVDDKENNDGGYNTITITIPGTRVAGLIITYLNGIYYIISAKVIPAYFQAGGFDTPTVTLTKTINIIVNNTASRVYMPTIMTSNSSVCRLFIIKGKSSGYQNNILVAQTSGVFMMETTYTAISMDYSTVLWFIVNVNNDITAYLPLCHYLGSGVTFITYPAIL